LSRTLKTPDLLYTTNIEAEEVGADDTMPHIMWTRNLLLE
jgi:hypothetical protein